MHARVLVQQLTPQRGGESVDGMLRPAVRRLQRNAPRSQSGPDLHDGAVPTGPHPVQCRHGPVHESQVADLGNPLEFLGGDVGERGEDRGERDVDPDVDRAEELLCLTGGVLDLCVVGHIGADRARLAARLLDVADGAVQPCLAAREQRDVGSSLAVEARCRAPDAGARAGDNHCLSHGCASSFGESCVGITPRPRANPAGPRIRAATRARTPAGGFP